MKRREFLGRISIGALLACLPWRRAKAGVDPAHLPSILPLQPDLADVDRRMKSGEWLVYNNGKTCLTNPRRIDGGIQCDVSGEPLNLKWTC